MNKVSLLKYLAALLCCVLLGCGVVLCLHLYDTHFDMPAPLSGGQTIDFSSYGFTLTVPDGYALNDYTTNNFAEGGDALFVGKCAREDIKVAAVYFTVGVAFYIYSDIFCNATVV